LLENKQANLLIQCGCVGVPAYRAVFGIAPESKSVAILAQADLLVGGVAPRLNYGRYERCDPEPLAAPSADD
jgi:hypothetical protein